MGFNFQNAYVCRWSTLPARLADVVSVPVDELTVIGIVRAEGGYTCKPEQREKSSTNRDYAITHLLEAKFEVLTAYAPNNFISDLDGKVNCLVLVNSDLLPDLDPENTAEGYKTLADLLGTTPLPANVTCTVLKPFTTFVEEDVKLGTGKVVPFVITGTKEGTTKDSLRKLNVPVVNE